MNGSINCIWIKIRLDLRGLEMWIPQLGGISQDSIHRMAKDGSFGSFDHVPVPTCESCLYGKMINSPFTGKGERVTELLGLIHLDSAFQNPFHKLHSKCVLERNQVFDYIKIWGCPAYVKLLYADKQDARKWEYEIELKELSNELENNTELNAILDPQLVVTQTPCSSSRDIKDPLNYNEAMSYIHSQKWLGAMKSEMDSMYTNQRKIGSDGKVETYKARLVAKGYKQREGIDYEETFYSVTMTKSIWIFLAIAAYHYYEIYQNGCEDSFSKWPPSGRTIHERLHF
ncbi:unnamed protein product [Prunus armeniaca]